MNTRNRNLLTLALATALAVPLAAAAQTETTQSELDAQEQATEALPPQANPLAERGQEVDPRVPVDEEDPMNAVPPPAPVETMGDAQVTDPSDVAHSSRWAELDVNGDGRIDPREASVDMDFNAGFEMMDTDGDGFVTDAEFRTHAMSNPPRNERSMEHEGMEHEGMEHEGMGHEGMGHDRMDEDGAEDDGTDENMEEGMDDGLDDPVDG